MSSTTAIFFLIVFFELFENSDNFLEVQQTLTFVNELI